MARTIRTPADLIGHSITVDGRRYEYSRFFRIGGAAAKNEVHQEGKRMKNNGEIANFRVRKYKLRVPIGPEYHYEQRTAYALFIR